MRSRRDLLAMFALAAIAAGVRAEPGRPRVASLDWALAETLLALGEPLLATVAASDWRRFIVEPALPFGVADLGLQQEINLELLARLRPQLILTSPFIQGLDDILPQIAPTRTLSIFKQTAVPLAHPRALTHEVAGLVGREVAALRFLEKADAQFDTCQKRLAALRLPPVLLVSFIDPRHVRVYGGSGIFQNVLDRVGIDNAWRRDTGYWGFATVGIEALAIKEYLHLVAVGPVPSDLFALLKRSPLWTRLPFVEARRVSILPPVFMFGAMPAALRFSRLLTECMERFYA